MADQNAKPTPITPPRVPIIDPRTGLIDRAWYQFFLSLFRTESDITYAALPPAAVNLTGELDDLQQTIDTQPSAALGTMAPLQQDNLPWVTFDTAPEGMPTTQPGTLYWDTADKAKTLALVMQDTGGVVQTIGETTYFRIKATSAITKGQVIMFTGTVGASGGLTGAPATGLTALQSEYILGVAAQNIALNGWGYVTWFGEIRGVNTTGGAEAWVDGQILYYNPAVTGGLTKTVPTAPNPKVIVAAVVHAASNGILFVRPTFGSALGETDTNVQITALADKNLLQYKAANSRWENIAESSLSVGTATNLAGGAANQVPYQTAPSTTAFSASFTFDGTVVSAPKFSPTGGTATGNGMYLPGTNTLCFSTNGGERIRVTSTGSVGIGATSPQTKLEVGDGAVMAGATGTVLVGRYSSGFPTTTSTGYFSLGTNNLDGANGGITVNTLAASALTERMRIDYAGNVVINTAAIATNATDGFLYVPTCAGTPTGAPTAYTGRAPIVVDTTNNKLYFYSGGAWRDAGP